MIETKDIKNMVAHIIRRDKGIADPQLMHPTREWFVGLFIAFVIVVCGSWFCVYIFSTYRDKMNTPVVVTEPAVPYQAARIAEAIKIFEAKQRTFSEILTGAGTTVAESPERPALNTIESTTTPKLIIEPISIVTDETESPKAMLAP